MKGIEEILKEIDYLTAEIELFERLRATRYKDRITFLADNNDLVSKLNPFAGVEKVKRDMAVRDANQHICHLRDMRRTLLWVVGMIDNYR